MGERRTHYELAFEAYLDQRGTPYVAVEDVRHFVPQPVGVKTFDYLVYPAGGPACLVDVKGRKSCGEAALSEARQKTWVTQADVDGLLLWQDLFGEDFAAYFVFAYWLADLELKPAGPDPEAPGASLFGFAGRRYAFWLVPVDEYARHQRTLSRRWKTVSVPREAFRSMSQRLQSAWPAAPC